MVARGVVQSWSLALLSVRSRRREGVGPERCCAETHLCAAAAGRFGGTPRTHRCSPSSHLFAACLPTTGAAAHCAHGSGKLCKAVQASLSSLAAAGGRGGPCGSAGWASVIPRGRAGRKEMVIWCIGVYLTWQEFEGGD